MKRFMLVGFCLMLVAPASAQTQAELNSQAGAAWKKADVAMTEQWKLRYAAMKRLDAQNRSRGSFSYAAALLDSQRAWLRFRDAECAIEAAEMLGGSMAPMVRAHCLARLTRERGTQLANLRWSR